MENNKDKNYWDENYHDELIRLVLEEHKTLNDLYKILGKSTSSIKDHINESLEPVLEEIFNRKINYNDTYSYKLALLCLYEKLKYKKDIEEGSINLC